MNFSTLFDTILQKIGSLTAPLGHLLDQTNLPKQIEAVDFPGLFSNPWFLVPFIGLVGYLLYKKAFRDITILGLILGAWYASGTPYMQTLVVNGELQMTKVLPVMFGGAVILGVVIYLLFGRSE